MEFLTELWLPILVSGVAVFFTSFVMWMIMPHHKSDWSQVPDEEKLREALSGADHGLYMFPFCKSNEDWKDPEFVKKRNDGPSGQILVQPRGPYSFPKAMGQSVVFNVVISAITAYIAWIGLKAGAEGVDVFRMTATIALLAYSGALFWDMIWALKPAKAVWKSVFDGLLYGLVTGAIFMAFWPAAA